LHFNIIDPGMRTYAGHHCDINTRVAREIVSRGHGVSIYVNRFFSPRPRDAELDIRPVFSANPYSVRGIPRGLGRIFDRGKGFERSAGQFAVELQQAGPAEAWLLPTLFPYQLYGLCRSPVSLPPSFLVMHNAPGWNGFFGEELWRKALEASRLHASRLHMGVFEKNLFLDFERLLPASGPSLHPFPIPHDGVAPRPRKALSTVGILGHQRNTKGLERLRQNVETIVKLGFKVIVQDSQENLADIFNVQSPSVTLHGYVDDLPLLVDQCDALFLDYDTQMYRNSGSGIAWEAIACGVPLVVPHGTTMSLLVETHGCGVKFAQCDPDDRFRALTVARRNYAELARNAAQASREYGLRHGTAKFVEFLLERI
jgi:glycosyltransferase involved in cell wall biosynthesis